MGDNDTSVEVSRAILEKMRDLLENIERDGKCTFDEDGCCACNGYADLLGDIRLTLEGDERRSM